jgi:MFS family permease
VLLSVLIGDAVYGFQQTAITPALPVVGQAFDASREWTTWVFSGYLIVASVMPIFLGKAADRVGKRRIYLAALGVFLLGSVVAAGAPSIAVVVIGRLIQGVGGIVFPLSFSMLRDHLPAHRVGSGIGVLTGGFGLGALAGFGLGGAITQFLSWRWVFAFGAIVLLAAIALVRLVVPADSGHSTAGLDTPGAALLGGAVAALIVALTEGPQRGWASPFVLAVFVVSVLAAAGWVFRELRTPEPLMDLRVLASRTVLLVNIASVLGGFAVFSVNILLPFLLEGSGAGMPRTAFGLAAGPLLTGIVLLPRALGQSVGGPSTGPLSRLLGAAPTFAVGLLVQAASAAGLALWRGSIWMLLAELGGLGIGFGITLSAAGGIVTLAATTTQTSIATSLNSVARRVGGGVGAQIAAALIGTITLAGGAPAPAGFTIAFLLAAAVSVAGAGAAVLAVPAHRLRSR